MRSPHPARKTARGLLVTAALIACLALAEPPAPGAETAAEILARISDDLLRRANRAFEAGDLETAANLYGELRQADPTNPAGWYGAGLAAEASEDFLGAIEYLSRAIELDPDRAEVHLAHGSALLRAGAAPQALDAFGRARRLDPKQANGYLFAALLLRDAGQLVEAEELLRSGLERARHRPELFDQLGLVLLSQRKSGEALSVADQGLLEFPASARLRLVRGLALADTADRRGAAITELERAIAGGQGGSPGLARLADLLVAENRLDEAIVRLEQAIELDSSDPQAHYRLGLALQRAGRAEDAAVALQRFQALRKERDQDQIRAKRLGQELNVVLEHIRANRLQEALDSVDRLLAAVPGHARSLAVKAKILFSLGKVEDAYGAAHAARIADPSKTEHHYLEGLLAYHSGELVLAESALADALAMDPGLGQAHELAALIAFRLERPVEAIKHFELAIASGVDSDQLRRTYAMALEAAQSQDE